MDTNSIFYFLMIRIGIPNVKWVYGLHRCWRIDIIYTSIPTHSREKVTKLRASILIKIFCNLVDWISTHILSGENEKKSYKLWILCNYDSLLGKFWISLIRYTYVLADSQFFYCKCALSNTLNVFFNLLFEMKTLIVRAQKMWISCSCIKNKFGIQKA